MNLLCTICGDDFTYPDGRSGRPPGTCSPECKAQTRLTKTRICRTCGTTFEKNPTLVFHCSDACRETDLHRCRGCHAIVNFPTRYCSAKCLVNARETERLCRVCKLPVPPPTHPPFNIMPRFCSDTCRFTKKSISYGMDDRTIDQARRLERSLSLSEYSGHLPINHRTIFQIPFSSAPTIPEHYPASIHSSIRWWIDNIPKIAKGDETLAIAFFMKEGPVGIRPNLLPLMECWPWIPDDIKALIPAKQWILKAWDRYHETRRTTEMGTLKNDLIPLLDAHILHGPGMKTHDKRSLKRKIERYDQMLESISNSIYVRWEYLKVIDTDEYFDLLTKIQRRVSSSKKYQWSEIEESRFDILKEQYDNHMRKLKDPGKTPFPAKAEKPTCAMCEGEGTILNASATDQVPCPACKGPQL